MRALIVCLFTTVLALPITAAEGSDSGMSEEAAAAAQAEAERRAQPSPVPGLTVGEYEDMPSFDLPLPEIFDENTTTEDLADHALIVARHERQSGELEGVDLEQRVAYIVHTWKPQLAARAQRIEQAKAERAARTEHEVEQARIHHQWQLDEEEHAAAHRKQMTIERRAALVDPLSPEQRAELEEMVRKYQERKDG
ncbi:MAG: hypothetical protein ACOCVS_03120 [Planctomycetota bacterium]